MIVCLIIYVVGVLNTGVMLIPNASKAIPIIEKWWVWPENHPSMDVQQYLITWPVEQQILVLFLISISRGIIIMNR
jgi:hypothetical protein